MDFFKWLFYIISILYGCLTVLGGATQLKQRKIYLWSSLSMLIAGLIILASPFILNYTGTSGIVLLILCLLAIHISAISNGIKIHGKINMTHHGVRLLISISIIALYFFSR